MSGLSHAAADAARPFRFVDENTHFVLLPWVNATGFGPGSFSPRSAGLVERDEAPNQERTFYA
jgi:hypothetical protein